MLESANPEAEIVLSVLERTQAVETIRRAIQLNESYQSSLNVDLLTYENRLKQFKQLMGVLEKRMRQYSRKRRNHLNTSYIIDYSNIPKDGEYFLIPKKQHAYLVSMNKFRTMAKLKQAGNNEDLSKVKKAVLQPNFSSQLYHFTPTEDQRLQTLRDSDPPQDWVTIGQSLNRSPIECVRRYLELTGQIRKSPWNEEENKALPNIVRTYGTSNWLQIANFFEGKTSMQCFHHWMKKLNPLITRGRWLPAEDLRLAAAFQIYRQNPKKQWSRIAAHIPGRTDVQCRERYCNILDPALKDEAWTPEEDEQLRLLKAQGLSWAEIAKHFGNRTDNRCWRRWKKLEKSFNRHALKAHSKSQSKPLSKCKSKSQSKSQFTSKSKFKTESEAAIRPTSLRPPPAPIPAPDLDVGLKSESESESGSHSDANQEYDSQRAEKSIEEGGEDENSESDRSGSDNPEVMKANSKASQARQDRSRSQSKSQSRSRGRGRGRGRGRSRRGRSGIESGKDKKTSGKKRERKAEAKKARPVFRITKVECQSSADIQKLAVPSQDPAA